MPLCTLESLSICICSNKNFDFILGFGFRSDFFLFVKDNYRVEWKFCRTRLITGSWLNPVGFPTLAVHLWFVVLGWH